MPNGRNRPHYLSAIPIVFSAALAFLLSGCMWGTVKDANTGASLVGAAVSYTDSKGGTGSTTTDANGIYFFDQASGAVPAMGPTSFEISMPGYDTLTVPRLVEYNDNPNASFADLSSFREAQGFGLSPSGTPTTTADMAVTDLYPDNQPSGTLWAKITNNGPDPLTNVSLQISCGAIRHDLSSCDQQALGELTVNGTFSLDPGQTADVNTLMGLDTSKYWYGAYCTVQTVQGSQGSFNDPDQTNDSYTEVIPPPAGDLELQDILLDFNTNKIGIRVQSSGSLNGVFAWKINLGSAVTGNPVPAGSQVFWTGVLVSGTQTVNAAVMACSPETNQFNNALVKTCSSVSHSCY